MVNEMKNLSRIITLIVAAGCIGLLVYMIFFFTGRDYSQQVTTVPQKQYTIKLDSSSLVYKNGVDFMEGVTATDEDGKDLTQYVTVSCKPTNDIHKKLLTYSLNLSGYEIKSVEMQLIVGDEYKGPSIKQSSEKFEIPLNKIGSLSAEIAKSNAVETDDGFGGSCAISAQIDSPDITVGDYVATVTAQNIFGDTASIKMVVTVTEKADSIIKLKASSVSLNKGDAFNPIDYVDGAIHNEYGDITSQVVAVNTVDTITSGTYTVEYRIKGIKELENEKAYLYVTVN